MGCAAESPPAVHLTRPPHDATGAGGHLRAGRTPEAAAVPGRNFRLPLVEAHGRIHFHRSNSQASGECVFSPARRPRRRRLRPFPHPLARERLSPRAQPRRERRAPREITMPNKMLIDASHPEETRVVVVRGSRVEEFDFEAADRKQLRGNIYLAKVPRVEPSLQAAFVDYGGDRHGFLAFSEIHPDYYQIPVADRQALIDEEERAQRAADDEVDRRSRRHRGRDRHAASHRDDDTLRSELAETPDGDAAPVDQAAEAAESHDAAEVGTSAADLLPQVSPESAPDSTEAEQHEPSPAEATSADTPAA